MRLNQCANKTEEVEQQEETQIGDDVAFAENDCAGKHSVEDEQYYHG